MIQTTREKYNALFRIKIKVQNLIILIENQ